MNRAQPPPRELRQNIPRGLDVADAAHDAETFAVARSP